MTPFKFNKILTALPMALGFFFSNLNPAWAYKAGLFHSILISFDSSLINSASKADAVAYETEWVRGLGELFLAGLKNYRQKNPEMKTDFDFQLEKIELNFHTFDQNPYNFDAPPMQLALVSQLLPASLMDAKKSGMIFYAEMVDMSNGQLLAKFAVQYANLHSLKFEELKNPGLKNSLQNFLVQVDDTDFWLNQNASTERSELVSQNPFQVEELRTKSEAKGSKTYWKGVLG